MSEGRKTILIAEDDSVIRELLTEMLKTAGYELLTATDGVEAVEAFKNYGDKVKLIISDIGMPRMGGMEAMIFIREMSPSVPIIILSIWEDPAYKKIAKQIGVKDYMKKPFNVDELIKKIRETLPNDPHDPPQQSSTVRA